MRSFTIFFAALLLGVIGFSPVQASAQTASGNICHKDFQAFFKAYAELSKAKQLEYVKFPFTEIDMTRGKNDRIIKTAKKVQIGYFASWKKIILSPKELKKLSRDNQTNYAYHIKGRGQDYEIWFAEENFIFDALVFKWENACWKMAEREVNNTGR